MSSIGLIGDPNAEPGSREWSLYTRERIRSLARDVKLNLDSLTGYVSRLNASGGLNALPRSRCGDGFDSLEEFLLAPRAIWRRPPSQGSGRAEALYAGSAK